MATTQSKSTFAQLIQNAQAGRLLKPIYQADYFDQEEIIKAFEKKCYRAAQNGLDGATIEYNVLTYNLIDESKVEQQIEATSKTNGFDIDDALAQLQSSTTITNQIHQDITVILANFCHDNNFKLIAHNDDYIVIF